jgi:hypothetical protein
MFQQLVRVVNMVLYSSSGTKVCFIVVAYKCVVCCSLIIPSNLGMA